MIEKRVYEVAGHAFALEMDSQSPLWEHLPNYAPFVNEGADPGFTVRVDQSLELPEEMKAVYKGEVLPEEPKLNLYRHADDWWVEMAPFGNMDAVAWLRMNESFSTGDLKILDPARFGRFAIDNSLMLMFAFFTSDKGTLEMHASVIVNEGRAYLFIAKSGTGKSTQSRMWLENIEGSELLNDDNPIVRVMEDGSIRAFGSPWSGKTPCYRNMDVPVGGIVRIRRCSENRITRLSSLEAYASMMSSCSGFRGVSSMADGLHSSIAKVVSDVPCYVLDCRPDPESAKVCHEGVCRRQ